MSEIDCEYERQHRQENHFAIIEELRKYFEKYPQTRFIQGLWALGIINRDKSLVIEDRFYEEPGQTLRKVKENAD